MLSEEITDFRRRRTLLAGRRPGSRNGRTPPSWAGFARRTTGDERDYIFGENHRVSEKTPHSEPDSVVDAANLAARSRGSATTFAVCDLIVRTEQEVKMANLYVFHQRSAINNAVWHGDSLTYGQNGNNPGTTSATRLAVVLNAVGPTW